MNGISGIDWQVALYEDVPIRRCVGCGATENVFGLPLWCDISKNIVHQDYSYLHDPQSVAAECRRRPHTCLHHDPLRPALTVQQHAESVIGYDPTANVADRSCIHCCNACSFLYARGITIGKAMGYRRIVTYTLASESGSSLRAVGFREVALVTAAHWHRENRPRGENRDAVKRIRWEITR